MIGSSYIYGLEETLGLHVILSNIFWWASLVLVLTAYRNRHIWNVGEMPWAFLSLTFLLFGFRELGHLSSSPLVASIRYLFGIWSAIFMTSAFVHLFVIIYERKKVTRAMAYFSFALSLMFPVFMLYLSIFGTKIDAIKNSMQYIENIIWIIGGSITVYTTYLLGTKSTGGFIKVFMFFQFAAFFAILWKFTGILGIISCPIPYSIREILETLFGVFAVSAMYILAGMLRNLSKIMHSD